MASISGRIIAPLTRLLHSRLRSNHLRTDGSGLLLKPVRVKVSDKMQKSYAYWRTKPIGREFRPGIQSRSNSQANAQVGRIWRQIHDRLSTGISGKLV